MTEQTLRLTPGCTVVIAAFDDVPEHRFKVEEILDDCVTGIALTGPFAGDYGEPELALILRVVSQD
ncbi:hypothetical protein [Pseudomonas sp.]|uniref:hypothetical protein n=1 Tax=Pseudomonadota TaxID=1224 RepID=UPI0025826204|nr:hypothetical protein [Pseudomonas sp.]